MFIKSGFELLDEKKKIEQRPETNHNIRNMQGSQAEDRWKEEVAMHLHMKNRKKYMHLYQLEKYFR